MGGETPPTLSPQSAVPTAEPASRATKSPDLGQCDSGDLLNWISSHLVPLLIGAYNQISLLLACGRPTKVVSSSGLVGLNGFAVFQSCSSSHKQKLVVGSGTVAYDRSPCSLLAAVW